MDGSNLWDACVEATGRTYGDGYGGALIYCADADNATIPLFAAARECVRYAFSRGGHSKGLCGDSDVARFVAAMAWLDQFPRGTIYQWRDGDGKRVQLHRSIRQNSDGTYEGGWTRREYARPLGWLIEGVQLVHGFTHLAGVPSTLRTQCNAAMAAAGHLGF